MLGQACSSSSEADDGEGGGESKAIRRETAGGGCLDGGCEGEATKTEAATGIAWTGEAGRRRLKLTRKSSDSTGRPLLKVASAAAALNRVGLTVEPESVGNEEVAEEVGPAVGRVAGTGAVDRAEGRILTGTDARRTAALAYCAILAARMVSRRTARTTIGLTGSGDCVLQQEHTTNTHTNRLDFDGRDRFGDVVNLRPIRSPRWRADAPWSSC